MPLLNSAQDTPFADQPQFMAEFVPPYDRGKIDADLIQLPNLTGNAENRREKAGTLGEPDVTLSDYQSLLNEPAALYWEPQSVTSIEVLKNVKPKLDNANDSIVPSGNFSGNDYIWQKHRTHWSQLLSLRTWILPNSESNDLFLSGIFFAVAATFSNRPSAGTANTSPAMAAATQVDSCNCPCPRRRFPTRSAGQDEHPAKPGGAASDRRRSERSPC